MDADLSRDLFARMSLVWNPQLAIYSTGVLAVATLVHGMKKRLRKKKHVGEFQEFGFHVDASLRSNIDREALCAFSDRFIAHIEANNLAFGGGIGPMVGGFVTRFDRGSATEDDRTCVATFLDRKSTRLNSSHMSISYAVF